MATGSSTANPIPPPPLLPTPPPAGPVPLVPPPSPTDILIPPGTSYPLPGNLGWSIAVDPDQSTHLRKIVAPASIMDLVPSSAHPKVSVPSFVAPLLILLAMIFIGYEVHKFLPHFLPAPKPAPTPTDPEKKPVWPSGEAGASPLPAKPLGNTVVPAEPKAVTAGLPGGLQLDGASLPIDVMVPPGTRKLVPGRRPEPKAVPKPEPRPEPSPICEWRTIGQGVEAYCQLNPDGNWYYQLGNPAVVRYTASYVAPQAMVYQALSCPTGGCR